MDNITANLQPLPGSLSYYCVIGNLRDALKYRSREAMGRNWQTIFENEILPQDHQTVEPGKVLQFVTEIAVPQRGRPGPITGAAQLVLKNINAINNGVRDHGVVFQNIEQPVEKIDNQPDQPVVNLSATSDAMPTAKSDLFDKMAERFFNYLMSLTKLDVVFAVTIGIADYGLTFILHEMGAAAAIVYTLISLHALGMAKNRYSQRTAQTGIVAVWALELGAFCIHMTMFNRRIWAAIDDMPFRVDDITDESRPFWIAVVLAILFSGAGIYAVSTTLALVTEQTEAENFEKQHGVKY